MLEGGVVELHHVALGGLARLQAAGQVRVDDVEPARAESPVEPLGVDEHGVALAHRAEQSLVGPGRPPLARHLDHQWLLLDDDAGAQLQQDATSASTSSSIRSRLRATTRSCGVWLASVPFASTPASKPAALKALASLPPPVATSLASIPQLSSAARAAARAAESRPAR